MSVRFLKGRHQSHGSPIIVDFDYDSFKRMEKKLSGMKRNLAKNSFAAAAKVSLMLINRETAEQIKQETFEAPPRKGGLRKTGTTKAGYKYKTERRRGGTRRARTWVNYAKPALRHTHLMENGYQHRGGAVVKGRKFRAAALLNKQSEAGRIFLRALRIGMELASKDPKGRVRSKAIENKIGKTW